MLYLIHIYNNFYAYTFVCTMYVCIRKSDICAANEGIEEFEATCDSDEKEIVFYCIKIIN